MPDHRSDEHIKNQLANYEAAFDPADWDRIEADLDTADWDAQVREKLTAYAAPFDLGAWKAMDSYLNSPFDTYIRKKISDFSTYFNPADWARMSMLLDDSLEASVRARLEDHEAPFRPSADWPIMASALDATFDDVVREKIGAFAEDAEMEEDWSLLIAGIASPFDREMQDKLVDHTVAYHPMEWMRMQAVLDAEEDDRAVWYLRWGRYAVAASFLLIAMLSVGGIDLLTDRLWKSADIAELTQLPVEDLRINGPENTNREGLANGPDGKGLTADADPEENEPATPSNDRGDVDAGRAKPTLAAYVAAEAVSNRIEPIDPGNSSIQQPTILQLVPAIATADPLVHPAIETGIEVDMIAGADKPRLMPDKKSRKDIALTAIRNADTPVMLGFFHTDLNDLIGGKVPRIDSRVNLKNPEIRLGLYLATTHSVAELNDLSQPGLGAGLRAEVRFDDEWSIVSGLLFTHKQFSHKYYIFADDRTQWENVLDAEFKSLEVPVLVKYRFPKTGKVQLYAQAGLATMVTLEENYLRYNPLSFENADRISRSVDKTQHIPTNQKLTLNTYVGNIQAAAGLEYEVSDRLSLQLEPYFQWGLQPMGTEQKSLHSLGVGTALVYNFGNKSS